MEGGGGGRLQVAQNCVHTAQADDTNHRKGNNDDDEDNNLSEALDRGELTGFRAEVSGVFYEFSVGRSGGCAGVCSEGIGSVSPAERFLHPEES